MAGITDVLTGEPQAVGCPYPFYAALRVEGGIHHDHETDVYVVSSHELIQKVNTNPRVFSNQNPMGPGIMDAVNALTRVLENAEPEFIQRAELVTKHGAMLFTADPPAHTRHRKLLNKAMTPKSVAVIEPQIEQMCNRLVDSFVADGRVELVSAYANPAPVYALAMLLGVEAERSGDFSRWAAAINAAIGRSFTDEQVRASIDGQMEFWQFFEQEFADRMKHPMDDLLTAVVNARVEDERPLDLEEMVSFASQLIGAGADTTSKLLASGTYMLATDRHLQDELRADPATIPRFIEEALRLESPVQGLFRITTEDTELGGVRIPADKYVWVVYASGNRDETVFEQVDQFRLDRGRMPHLAFGHGPHACLGSALARAVGRLGFSTLLGRLDDIALAEPGAAPDYDVESYVLHGMRSLPLTFVEAGR